MVQVDLITGFLGAGKTTFLRRYVRYLVEQGHNVCILENDFGAVNVDAMLVQDLLGGLVGIGTLICAFCLGPFIQFFNGLVSERVLHYKPGGQ